MLAGEFLPARQPVDQVILGDRAARLRLAIERDGDSLRVENGLDATVTALEVRDPDGEFWELGGSLAPGKSAMLVRGEWTIDTGLRDGEPAPATYVARLVSNPFADDCGIDTNELQGSHRVYGILDPDGEEWR